MTIDKAIKTQTDYLDNPFLNFHGDLREAIKLGIEALKFIADYRERVGPRTILSLKGETDAKERR